MHLLNASQLEALAQYNVNKTTYLVLLDLV
jgi:hypothetical protein